MPTYKLQILMAKGTNAKCRFMIKIFYLTAYKLQPSILNLDVKILVQQKHLNDSESFFFFKSKFSFLSYKNNTARIINS